jgi:hypothetical protein
VILAPTGERARPQPQAAGHHRKKEHRSGHDSDGALIKEKIVERVNGIPEGQGFKRPFFLRNTRPRISANK